MPVPLFDTNSVYEPLRAEVDAAIAATVDSGRFILGPQVEAFEREFAEYLGAEHVVGVANGTDALTIALRAVGVGDGDEVVVPSYTFYATAEAVPHTGARPVFCDIDPDTFCMTAETVSAALTPATKAIVCVHLFGNVAPAEEIAELAAERGIALVEDAAQAAGARLDGRRAGVLGDAATFSFFPSKNLFCFGDGGAVVTNEATVAERARSLRKHGSRDKQLFEEVGYNSRLDEIQAAILRVFLPHLDGWNAARRAVAAQYEGLGLGEFLQLPAVTAGAEHVYHLYVARVRAETDRGELARSLDAAGIGTRSWYERPVHLQPAMIAYHEAQGAPSLPATAAAAASNISLPIGPGRKSAEIETVVRTVAALSS